MEGQMCLYDLYGKPDYHGSRDEIVRSTVEDRFEQSINLYICRCGENPQEKFRGCHEYFVACPTCGRRTKSYRHMYEAMQAWNRSMTLPDGYVTGDIRHKPKKKGDRI